MGKEYDKVVAEWLGMYEEPKDIEDWLECSKCGYKPKVWEADNVRQASCACASGYSKYDKKIIAAESIGELVRRTNGNMSGYDVDELKDNWNGWVTGSEK